MAEESLAEAVESRALQQELAGVPVAAEAQGVAVMAQGSSVEVALAAAGPEGAKEGAMAVASAVAMAEGTRQGVRRAWRYGKNTSSVR